MNFGVRSILAVAVPTLGGLIGFLLYRRRSNSWQKVNSRKVKSKPKHDDDCEESMAECPDFKRTLLHVADSRSTPTKVVNDNSKGDTHGVDAPLVSKIAIDESDFLPSKSNSQEISSENECTDLEILKGEEVKCELQKSPETPDASGNNTNTAPNTDCLMSTRVSSDSPCTTQVPFIHEYSLNSTQVPSIDNQQAPTMDSPCRTQVLLETIDNTYSTEVSTMDSPHSTEVSAMDKAFSWADSMDQVDHDIQNSMAISNNLSSVEQSVCNQSDCNHTATKTSSVSHLERHNLVQHKQTDDDKDKQFNVRQTCESPGFISNPPLQKDPERWEATTNSESNGSDQDLSSEVSTDSGQGGSVAEGLGECSSLSDSSEGQKSTYSFDIPTEFCGQMIGRHGRNINRIKDKCGVEVTIKKKLYTQDVQLVMIEGSPTDINKALTMLREKFPLNRYPTITFETAPQDCPVLYPEMMQLSLPEGVSVDVLVCSVVSTNHVFLQQPTHPSFYMLERLNHCMNLCYSQEDVIPQLPRPIEVGVICAAPMYNTGWYRAQVVESYPESDEVQIKFVDYGGYMRIPGQLLRQIRSDFSALPFQAVECYMANIIPPKGEEYFPSESIAVMEQLVQGKLLQAQVVGHEENSVPYIQLYEIQGDKAVFINRELVNSGVGQWIEHLL